MLKYIYVILFLISFSSSATCYDFAGKRFGISPDLLRSISIVESNSESGLISKANSNGSYDIGIMQINSSHLSFLKSFGIDKTSIRNDDCINILVAAYLLKKNFIYYKNERSAIGAYNAGYSKKKSKLRSDYADKVLKVYASRVKKNNNIPPPHD